MNEAPFRSRRFNRNKHIAWENGSAAASSQFFLLYILFICFNYFLISIHIFINLQQFKVVANVLNTPVDRLSWLSEPNIKENKNSGPTLFAIFWFHKHLFWRPASVFNLFFGVSTRHNLLHSIFYFSFTQHTP